MAPPELVQELPLWLGRLRVLLASGCEYLRAGNCQQGGDSGWIEALAGETR